MIPGLMSKLFETHFCLSVVSEMQFLGGLDFSSLTYLAGPELAQLNSSHLVGKCEMKSKHVV